MREGPNKIMVEGDQGALQGAESGKLKPVAAV
jgi:hypothetical protein